MLGADAVVEGPGPDRAMVFQDAALFPWLCLRDNIEFPLKLKGISAAARAARSEELLRLVHLWRFRDRNPHELSGGMRQRGAIARALATDPAVLLMDEPFAALDAQTREILQGEVERIWSATRKTVVFVTHNVREAVRLADRVVLMGTRPGRILHEEVVDLPRPEQPTTRAWPSLRTESDATSRARWRKSPARRPTTPGSHPGPAATAIPAGNWAVEFEGGTMTHDRDGVRAVKRGKVWLVGAGPGDPELLTVRAHKLLASARVVAFDELVSPAILDLAPAAAERIPVGRRAGGCRHHEARIHPLVVGRALEGYDVIRLKGGDPLVFGRGGEEAEELAAARVPFEIVPGISAALGAAASAGIPLTHRDCASSVTLATAHAAGEGGAAPDLVARVPAQGTLVFYMGLGRLGEMTRALVEAGRSPETPAAVVSRATLPGERVVVGTLGDIASRAAAANLEAPALLVIGEVVARRVESSAVAGVSGPRDHDDASALRVIGS